MGLFHIVILRCLYVDSSVSKCERCKIHVLCINASRTFVGNLKKKRPFWRWVAGWRIMQNKQDVGWWTEFRYLRIRFKGGTCEHSNKCVL
jgi:hypothetical protein